MIIVSRDIDATCMLILVGVPSYQIFGSVSGCELSPIWLEVELSTSDKEALEFTIFHL